MRLVRRFGPWVLLVLATAVLAAILSTPQVGEPLHPRGTGPDGAQALAEVLQDQGVEVELVDGTAALDPEQAAPGTTVLLPHTRYLGEDSGPALVRQLTDVDRLVVLVPDGTVPVGAALGLDVDVTWGSGYPVQPDCTLPQVRDGDRVSGWDVLLSADGPDRADVVACYPPGPGHNAGGAREGAVLTYPATADRPEIVLAGIGTSWTNAAITDEANAAVALRLLGGSERLLWVLPQPADAGADAARSLWDVLPRNLTAAVWVLGAAVLALALWQGRRLGAVVSEPLPAVVRASETTRSRGRLYRQAGDRDHAIAALQAGARRRTAPLLGLSRSSEPEQLVVAVTSATGRPVAEVRRLLLDPGHVPDDAALVTLARALRALEDQLAHPDRPHPTGADAPYPTERTP